MEKQPHDVDIPAGGWGSAKATLSILHQEQSTVPGTKAILRQNKQDGFTCVSCSWTKPAHPHSIEACENGIKATAWELTSKRTTPEFFAAHTVSELRTWSDLDLEEHGRLTYPLRYEKESDRYVPVAWEDAFRDIGRELR